MPVATENGGTDRQTMSNNNIKSPPSNLSIQTSGLFPTASMKKLVQQGILISNYTRKAGFERAGGGGCLEGSLVRVLVVEDYEAFRRYICSALSKNPRLQIVGEASDGLEAISKAQELRPDLIVLDIGLPKLHGLKAAQQIREISPESRIVILSLESSPDVVEEALNCGAMAYVVKSRTGSDLLKAVEAVLDGRQFLSDGLQSNS
jgi:CheY-like chemotaxis protein